MHRGFINVVNDRLYANGVRPQIHYRPVAILSLLRLIALRRVIDLLPTAKTPTCSDVRQASDLEREVQLAFLLAGGDHTIHMQCSFGRMLRPSVEQDIFMAYQVRAPRLELDWPHPSSHPPLPEAEESMRSSQASRHLMPGQN